MVQGIASRAPCPSPPPSLLSLLLSCVSPCLTATTACLQALSLLEEWLTTMKCTSGETSYAFVSFGDFDIGTMVPKQCRLVSKPWALPRHDLLSLSLDLPFNTIDTVL